MVTYICKKKHYYSLNHIVAFHTLMLGDFNSLLLSIGHPDKNLNREMLDISDIINQFDLTDIYKAFCQVVVEHAFNPSTWKAEAGRFLSYRSAWSTE